MGINPVSSVKSAPVRPVSHHSGLEQNMRAQKDKTERPIDKTRFGLNDQLDKQKIQGAVDAANDVVKAINKGFEFEIHDDTNRIMVRVINKDTQEVIREIPPEEILDMLGKMWRAVGILIDKKI
ncbi:MAG: flagellar protein FlaG [Clostridia bacterium]|nr:flagellar protein FlaG [Clostridia bacterium]